MPKYGKIPTRLKVFLRATIQFPHRWRGPTRCTPAFVTDEDRPKTHDTARYWASQSTFRPETPRSTKVEGVAKDNKPFATVTLIGHEARNEGGHAFKVITPDGWLVDLRGAEFYEVLFKKGIPKSGIMKGPFQWVVNGSQMRLTLVGSPLHKEIAELDKVRQKPRKGKLRVRDLEVGGVYASKSGNQGGVDAIYLGRCRLKGKLRCAWVYVAGHYTSVAGCQAAYDRAISDGWRQPTVILTNGCSYTDLIGNVKLEPNLRESPRAERVEFQNGYGERLLKHEISGW